MITPRDLSDIGYIQDMTRPIEWYALAPHLISLYVRRAAERPDHTTDWQTNNRGAQAYEVEIERRIKEVTETYEYLADEDAYWRLYKTHVHREVGYIHDENQRVLWNAIVAVLDQQNDRRKQALDRTLSHYFVNPDPTISQRCFAQSGC